METIGRPGDAGAIMVSFFFWMTLTSRNWEEEIKGAWCKGKIPCRNRVRSSGNAVSQQGVVRMGACNL